LSTTAIIAGVSGLSQRQKSLLLVTLCTFVGAAAQVLIKSGAGAIQEQGLLPTLVAMALNFRLVFGYSLYGLSAAMMVLALKHGELSILYPIIALTYVWVSILSVVIFRENMSLARAAGIALIVLGVAVLGRGEKS
jgi:uncharacterized membrane protein